MKSSRVSIWFLIGLQLAIFGLLIAGAGIYDLFAPPAAPTELGYLHPAIWWGALMLLLGVFYTVKFRPGKS
jgi:hypothetical protein